MKLNIELYQKVDLLGTEWVYKRPITGTGKETYRKTSDRSPRLLSVQVSQTPGLYAGPGIYPGPGLYHNNVKFVIQKIVNFHVYRVSVFCLFSH